MPTAPMTTIQGAASIHVAGPRGVGRAAHLAPPVLSRRAMRLQRTVTRAKYDEGIERSLLESMDFEDGVGEGMGSWMNDTLINLRIRSSRIMDEETKRALGQHFGEDLAVQVKGSTSSGAPADLYKMPAMINVAGEDGVEEGRVVMVGHGERSMRQRNHFLRMAAHQNEPRNYNKSMRSRDRLLHNSAIHM